MPDAECSAKGIPEHLHRNDRPANQSFPDNEKLWMRFSPEHPLMDGKPPPGIFRPTGQSVNRELMGESEPLDVLYSIHGPPHPSTHGILEFNVSAVTSLRKPHPEQAERIFTFRVIHMPERCMYPHCEIQAYLDGQPLEEVRPNKIKTWLREAMHAAWRVIKQPSS